jgi:acetyltransferase-like isoleucine patch superfamily enzyme
MGKCIFEEKYREEKMLKELKIDEGVVLNYPTGRNIKKVETIIGHGAKIRKGTIIYESSIIGKNLETGHNVVIREENQIGDDFSIWNNSVIDYGCRIGHRVKVHCNVYIAQYTLIEDEVFIAPGVTVANDLHPVCTKCMQGPTIKKRARIGVNVTLLPQITIGEEALVGAGSVVTKDIPPYALVYGNPARVVGDVRDLKCKKNLHPQLFPYRKEACS